MRPVQFLLLLLITLACSSLALAANEAPNPPGGTSTHASNSGGVPPKA